MPPPVSTDKILTQARKSAKSGDWLAAFEQYQSVLTRFPGNSRAKKGLTALRQSALSDILKAAQTAQTAGQLAEAERGLAAAASLAPELPEVGIALTTNRLESGRAPAALTAANAVLQRSPEHIVALNLKARALREMGRSEASQACLSQALTLNDTHPQTLNSLGILARAQGDRDAAASYYRRAIAQSPQDAALHRNLAHAITYTPDEPHLDQLRAVLAEAGPANPNIAPNIAPLHFALFKALDDLDQKPAAFASLEIGNRLTKSQLGYDFQTDAVPYALSKTLFQSPLPTHLPAPAAPRDKADLRPVFITGLPRSGTTLVERILSQAEATQPCGELTVVQVAVAQMLRNIMSRRHKALTPDDIAALRRALLSALHDYSDGSPFLIDKMPLNFRWIGYICAALPEARIVHINRDPMAVAWSLYRYSFSGAGNGFVYDPKDIARFMVLHRDLMAHWRKICPGRIFDLNYGDLIRDTKAVTQSLAKATGLNWTPDMLTPENAKSQVLTASADQVRRPIYRGSDQQWQRYQAQLAPLSQALQDAGLLG